jgi:hypothetical protein
MASGKEIAGGIVGLVILGSLVQPDEHAPPPPQMCQVPQLDGTTIPVEVTSIPCDQMVVRALAAIEEAKSLPSKLPESVTIEVTPPATASQPEPAITATPEQLREIGQPLKEAPEDDNVEKSDEAASAERT